VLTIGFLGAFCATCPIWLPTIAYLIARSVGAKSPGLIGVFVGIGLVCILPVWLLGNALYISYRHKKEPKASSGNDEAGPRALPGPEYAQLIDIWKASVEVQQHFNDLELRIRNFAVTLLVGILGATAFALKEHYIVSVLNFKLSLAVAVCIAGIPGWLGFYFMDRHWYHRLLIGSVKQTVHIEDYLRSSVPEVGLSKAIGKESPTAWGPFEIHSSEKIDLFYSVGLAILTVLAGALLLIEPSNLQGEYPPPHVDDVRPTVIQAIEDHCASVNDKCAKEEQRTRVEPSGKKSKNRSDLRSR